MKSEYGRYNVVHFYEFFKCLSGEISPAQLLLRNVLLPFSRLLLRNTPLIVRLLLRNTPDFLVFPCPKLNAFISIHPDANPAVYASEPVPPNVSKYLTNAIAPVISPFNWQIHQNAADAVFARELARNLNAFRLTLFRMIALKQG